jgi:uncharacterized RDD family membrane protein YckC
LPPPGWPPGYPIHPAYARLFTPAPRPHGYPLADVGRRLAARVVDITALAVINVLVNGWFVYQLYLQAWPWYRAVYQRTQQHQPIDDLPQPQDVQTLAFTITVIAFALWLAYEVPGLADRGQTLGKRLLGLKVLRLEAAEPLGYGRALRRWNPLALATVLWIFGFGLIFQESLATLMLAGMLGAVLLFVDYLFAAVDQPLHQSLRDKSAGTVVVDVKQPGPGNGPGPRGNRVNGEAK